MSLRLRYVLGMCAIFLIGLAWMFQKIRVEARPRYKEAVEESLVDMANAMAAVVSTEWSEGHPESWLIARIFEDLRTRKVNAQIYNVAKTDFKIQAYVTDDKGRVLYDSIDAANVGADFSRWNDVYLTLRGEYGARSTRANPADPGSSVLYVGAPVRAPNGAIIGSVTVSKPTKAMETYMQKSMQEILRASYIAGAGVIIVGVLFSFAVTRPINRLVEYAQRNRNGARFPLPNLSAPEFRRLGEAFEEMRIALEGRKEIEAYVQALTHEIKSPLTAIRGAGELLEEDLPREERSRFLANIRTESSRIQGIVDSLLDLAALEARGGLNEVKPLDLQRIVEEVVESLRPVTLKKRLEIVTEFSEVQEPLGERFLIFQSVRNIVQNAIDFSPDGATITIRAKGSSIEVLDEGPGLPDYALPRVFERFYSLGRPESGKKSSGLGLSFVKEAAALHRGSIALQNREGARGAHAVLKLQSLV